MTSLFNQGVEAIKEEKHGKKVSSRESNKSLGIKVRSLLINY